MARSKFKIVGRLDECRPQSGTVTVDRDTGLFSVRPARRHRVYTLPLSTVAEIVVSKIIKAEIAEKRAAKKAKRKGGGLHLK